MTSVYERDYVTVGTTADEGGLFRTHGELEAHVAELQRADEGGRGQPRVREGGGAARSHQAAARAASWVWPGAGADVAPTLQDWTKAALLEVQEYVRLIGKVGRAVVTPPVLLPRHRRAVRRDRRRLADGRAADRDVHRAWCWRSSPGSRSISSARARWSAGWSARRWCKELGPVLTGPDGRRARRIGHRRGARVDDGDRSDRGAARARHRSDPQAGRAADPRRPADGAAPDRRVGRHRHGRRLDRDRAAAPRRRRASTGTASSRGSTSRTSGWGSSSRSFSASRS